VAQVILSHMKKDEFATAVDRLREVNEVMKDLEPALQPEAIKILSPYVTGQAAPTPPPSDPNGGGSNSGAGNDLAALRTRLLAEHGDAKPADNTLMCAAVWFAEYGKEAFSLDQLRSIANELGVTLPDRVDATIGGGMRKGKKLFNRARVGYYAPTVHGETFLKTTYNVQQGQGTPAASE
jgi:hypothetical protein